MYNNHITPLLKLTPKALSSSLFQFNENVTFCFLKKVSKIKENKNTNFEKISNLYNEESSHIIDTENFHIKLFNYNNYVKNKNNLNEINYNEILEKFLRFATFYETSFLKFLNFRILLISDTKTNDLSVELLSTINSFTLMLLDSGIPMKRIPYCFIEENKIMIKNDENDNFILYDIPKDNISQTYKGLGYDDVKEYMDKCLDDFLIISK